MHVIAVDHGVLYGCMLQLECSFAAGDWGVGDASFKLASSSQMASDYTQFTTEWALLKHIYI